MHKKYTSNLTQKQELFCHKFIELGNASAAYREVYSTENMKAKTVWENASRLRAKDKVKARIRELTELELNKSGYKGEDIIKEIIDRAFFNTSKVLGRGKFSEINPAVVNSSDMIEVRKRKETVEQDNGDLVDEEIVSYDFSSKQKALLRLCKYLGM